VRTTVSLALAVAGLALFVAGDAIWLRDRRRGQPLDLRLTGTLIGLGVLLFLVGALLREP